MAAGEETFRYERKTGEKEKRERERANVQNYTRERIGGEGDKTEWEREREEILEVERRVASDGKGVPVD